MRTYLLDRATRIEARWWTLPGAVRWSAFIAASVLILFTRSPGTLLGAEFANEDGQTFFLGTYFGSPPEVIFRPYAGYLQLVPRLVAYAERMVPIAWAPLMANFASLLIVAVVAAFIASDRLAQALPHRGFRWLLAAVLLLLPAEQEVFGTITNTIWFLGLFLMCVLLAGPARSRFEAIATRVCLVLASLSGPFGLLLSPLFVLRAVRERSRDVAWSAACVMAPGLLQLVALVKTASERPTPIGSYSTGDLLGAFLSRVITEPILGARVTHIFERVVHLFTLYQPSFAWAIVTLAGAGAIAMGVMLVVLFRAASKHVSRWTMLVVAYTVVTVAALGAFVNPLRSEIADPYLSQRYLLFTGFAVVAIILGGISSLPKSRQLLKDAALVLLTVGIVCDFSLPERPKYGWPATSVCIGGSAPCVVPVYGGSDWSIHWPGPGGVYNQTPPWPPSQYRNSPANSPSLAP